MDLGLVEVPAGLGQEPGCLPVSTLLAGVREQAGDLGPDQRAVGDVPVLQGFGVALPGELPVGGQEPAGEVGPAEVLEVHGQEAGVVEHVTPAEPRVELDAVEDPRAVVEAEDVLREQVPMTVDDPALGHTVGEQRVSAVEIAQRLSADTVEQVAVEDPPRERRGLLEVGGPEHGQVLDRARKVDRRSACGAGMERGHAPRNGCEEGLVEVGIGDHGGQPAIGRQPPHHDEVIDGGPALVDHIVHAEVHVRGEPAVELDLPSAVGQAQLPGREVQERGPDRLAHLVHPVPDEEQHRDVGLDHGSPLHTPILRACAVAGQRPTSPNRRAGSDRLDRVPASA